MNEISETLYIADLETYELYFLNEAGQRSFHTKDFYGRKCYEVLQEELRHVRFVQIRNWMKAKLSPGNFLIPSLYAITC